MRQTRKVVFRFALAAAMCGVFGSPAAAQTSVRDALLRNWNDIGRKLVTMAEEFPEDKYEYRPTPQVRTFAQQMLHVAFWNQYLSKAARGEKPDGSQNELPRSQYKTKAAVVQVVRTSFAEAASVLKGMNDQQTAKTAGLWDGFAEHNGEHYGQLVMYYRLNKIVPPESRPKK